MTDRLLIVGWDGADWDIVDDLIERGVLPHVREMVETGVRGVLRSPLPDHSWAAWPTFLTGMDPGGHGVFDFMERHPTASGRRDPILSTSIGVETFLESLSSEGHEVRAGNIPVTFPPFPVNGRLDRRRRDPSRVALRVPRFVGGRARAGCTLPDQRHGVDRVTGTSRCR